MKSPSLKKQQARLGYSFVSLWIVGFLLFTLFPFIFSIFMSLNNVNMSANGFDVTWLGFYNYRYALTLDVPFLIALWDTTQFVLILTPLVIILSMMLSMLLNQKLRFRGLFRAIYFLPVIILSGSLYNILYEHEVFSLIDLGNATVLIWLENIGISFIYHITSFLMQNITTVLWFSGVQILIYISGLQKISKEMYEAASIDGASPWQTFWKLTLPALKPFTVINIIYTIVLLATFPSSPVMQLIRDKMFDNQLGFGYAAAISWIYFIIIIIILVVFVGIVSYESKAKREE